MSETTDKPYVAPSVMSTDGGRIQESSAKPRPVGQNPHFERMGGREAIAKLVERFYHHMSTLPDATVIRAMHPEDLSAIRDVLTRYLIQWMGGPALYSAERGHPRLRRRHLPFRIGPEERDAWMLCMRKAMAEVIDDDELRAQLDAAFYKTADFMRNDPEHRHHHHADHEPA